MPEKAKFHFVKDSPHIFIDNPIGSFKFERYDYDNGDTRWEIKKANNLSDKAKDMKKYIAYCYNKKDKKDNNNYAVSYKRIIITESDLSYIPHKEKILYDKIIVVDTTLVDNLSSHDNHVDFVEKFTDIDFANIIRRELRADMLMSVFCPSIDAYGLPAKESEYYYELYCNPVKNKLTSSIFDK